MAVDATVVAVALPAIEAELGGGLNAQQWVVSAYLLTLGALLPAGGSIGDAFGVGRVFTWGLAIFGVASIACAVAPSAESLIAARTLQGVCGAVLTPNSLALLIGAFDDDERGAAIGSWTAWSGAGIMIGPLVGGELIDTTSWRWIFAINVPAVAIAIALVRHAAPRERAVAATWRPDFAGMLLAPLGLGGVIFSFIEQPEAGWSSAATLAPLLGGVALLGAFVAREASAADPMLRLELFRRRNFSIGNLETLLVYAGMAVLSFFLTVFLQQIADYSAFEAGLTLTPPTLVMLVLARRFGALADRHGPRLFMGAGPALAGLGMLLLTRLDADVSYAADLLPALAVFGLGLAITVAPLTTAVLAGTPRDQAGIASATNIAVARIAGSLATAVVGALVAAQFAAGLDSRLAGDLSRRPARDPLRAAIARARAQPLAKIDVDGLPRQARARTARAGERAAIESFHLAMVSGSVLMIAGGALGALGVTNRPTGGGGRA